MHEKENGPLLIRFGPFTLDGRSGELRNGPTRLKVPDQSIAVLQALLERPGELVTRESLRDRLWGPETFVDFEAGLNAAVRRLREALNDSADTPRYVETLPRRGYRFIAPVDGTSPAAPSAAAPSASAKATADTSVGSETPASARSEIAPSRRVRLRHVALAALALAVIGAALWGGLRRNDAAPAAARPMPITSFPGMELDPAISPAGNFVAFAWEGEGGDNFDIYVQSIDGESKRRLTDDAAADHAPVWSPDGQRIAFVRVRKGKREIFVVPVLEGREQRLFEAGPEFGAWFWAYRMGSRGRRTTSTWSSAIGVASVPSRRSYLYSFEDGQKRQLTRPPANLSDIHPVVSPDGRYLAFVRQNPHALDGSGSVFVHTLEQLHVAGEPVQLTFGANVLAFDWTRDSRSVIHDGGFVTPGLWRVAVAGGAPEPVLPNTRAARPSVARVRRRHRLSDMDRSNRTSGNCRRRPPRIASPQEMRPIARSRRRALTRTCGSHRMEPESRSTLAGRAHSALWVSNRDGSQAKRLTHFEDGRVGSPCWTADGKQIAFDAIRPGGSWNLYSVPADGGPVKPLTSDAFNNTRPSWSLDGRWIYFASDRTGDWQIWKMPSAGGKPEQITRGGGSGACRLVGRPTRLLRQVGAYPGHLGGPGRGRPGSSDRLRPGQAAEF